LSRYTRGVIGRAAWIAASCLVVHVANADPIAYRVLWTRSGGSEACIETPALIAGVEARLGRSLGAAGSDARVVDGSVERTETGGFHARILVRDERGATLGERELDEPSADCRALDAKLTLVIALAIDPDAVARTAADPAPISPIVTPPVPPPPVTPPPVATTPSSPWHVELGVFGVGAYGVMPGVGAATGIAVTIDAPRVPAVVASASAWLPDRTSVDAGGSRFTRIGGGLEVCPSLLARGRAELAICAGVDVARMTATGFDFDTNTRVIDWVVHGVGATVGSWWLTPRWRLAGAIGAWVPITRPRFVYMSGTETRVVYEGPAAAALVRVGIAVRF